jgi:hypothetical protein
MANLLQAAYNNIQGRITAIETCDPYMMTDVSLQVSIDDLGEFSIFSEEYKLGVDYRVASGYGATENTDGGTVVAMNGSAMTLVNGAGFGFDQEYMELKEEPSQWKDTMAKLLYLTVKVANIFFM